jgi:hypothetical protein
METKIYHSDPAFQYGLRQVAITSWENGELKGSKQDFYENIEAVYICVDKKYIEIIEVLFAFCEKNVRYLRKYNLIPKEVNERIKRSASIRSCKDLGLEKANGTEKFRIAYMRNLYKFVYWEFIQSHTCDQVNEMFNNIKE